MSRKLNEPAFLTQHLSWRHDHVFDCGKLKGVVHFSKNFCW